jgi:serine/threonine-protein kinase
VTHPNRPLPPLVQEMWKTFVTTVNVEDRERTITSFELRAAQETRALVSPPQSSPVAVAELPSMQVTTNSIGQNELVTADFEVTGVLGEGGMGRVLLARQKSLQRDVALKVLKGDESRREVVETLLAEAVITGSIEHPSIVPVHALGRDKNGRPILVMKRIDGVSWRTLVEDPKHLMWESLGAEAGDRLDVHFEILMAVCNAVHYAHSRGVIHRDIKLNNVMIGGFGEVYLVDWGIAIRRADVKEKNVDVAELEAPIGTLAYMAPEMAMGDVEKIDARTDVYLLGATLHYLLTGKPRHQGETPLDLLLSARDSENFEYGPNVAIELAAICNRAMHVEPEQRYASALEMRQALALFRRHRGSLALSAKAFAKMAELGTGEWVDERRMQQAMTECRFALMQALETWSGNQAAKEGLDKVLERMVEYEIAQRDVEGARALWAELSVKRPDLEKRIEDLAAEIQAAKGDAARLQAMERDADLRVGARFQMVIIAILPTFALLSFFILLAVGGANPSYVLRQLVLFPAVLLLLFVGTYLIVRKRIVTAIGRRAFALLLLYPVALLLHRLFAIAHGDSIPSMLTTDMIFSAILSLSFGISIFRRLALLSVLFLAGALAIFNFPQHATLLFIAFASVAAVFLAGFWGRMSLQTEQ